MKKDLLKISIDEIYSKPPLRNYPTFKIIFNLIGEILSIDLADFSHYTTSNIKGYRNIFVIIDNFSKYLRAIPLKNKYSQTITKEFSKILSTSKRSPVKLKSDRGAEFYDSSFRKFLRSKNIQHYSKFTDEGPLIAEKVIRTIRNLIKEPVFLKRNANWLCELPFVFKLYNNTIHNSVKMSPVPASKIEMK